ncbi:MAG: hypothetical protein MR443_11100 [Lachnospiraceae bacterium]|nr:hypothetical protein [Lachnospiraceae bacterium]
MTNKELVQKTLRFEKTETTPFAILNGQMWICNRNNLTVAQFLDLPDAGAQLLVDTYKEIGTCLLTGGCAASWAMISVMGGIIDMDRIAAEIVTRPLSEISDIDNYDVKEVIEKMRADHYYQRTLVQTRKMRDLVGEEYYIGGGFFGPFTVAAQMLGMDDFMVELLSDEDGYVDKLLDFANEICIAYMEDLFEAGLDLITNPEPVASEDLISPAMFEEFVLPLELKFRDRLKEKCPDMLVHICGMTKDLVKPLADNNFSMLSVDSIDMIQASKDADKRMVMFGNLNPANILTDKTADEVYEISKKLCEDMKPYGGFILAPGCDLAPGIPLENLQAMAKAAKEVSVL